jgi:lipoprotein signal peptidase
VVRLQRDEKPGAFMSLGDSLSTNARRVLFAFGGAVLVIGTAFLALRSRRRSSAHILGAALISGGGFWNLIDRVTQVETLATFSTLVLGHCARASLTALT